MQARYRVYFFGRSDENTSWSTDTYDVTGADVLDVVTWAERQAGPERLFAVALVVEDSREEDAISARRGLVRLTDGDFHGDPLDEDEERLQRRLRERRHRQQQCPQPRRPVGTSSRRSQTSPHRRDEEPNIVGGPSAGPTSSHAVR